MPSGPIRLLEETLPLEANSRECSVLYLSAGVSVIQAAPGVYIELRSVLQMTLTECIHHIARVSYHRLDVCTVYHETYLHIYAPRLLESSTCVSSLCVWRQWAENWCLESQLRD